MFPHFEICAPLRLRQQFKGLEFCYLLKQSYLIWLAVQRKLIWNWKTICELNFLNKTSFYLPISIAFSECLTMFNTSLMFMNVVKNICNLLRIFTKQTMVQNANKTRTVCKYTCIAHEQDMAGRWLRWGGWTGSSTRSRRLSRSIAGRRASLTLSTGLEVQPDFAHGFASAKERIKGTATWDMCKDLPLRSLIPHSRTNRGCQETRAATAVCAEPRFKSDLKVAVGDCIIQHYAACCRIRISAFDPDPSVDHVISAA